MPLLRRAAALPLVLLATAAVSVSADYITASDPRVQWSGRPNVNVDGSMSFDIFTSASFVVRGLGAAVTLIANVTLPAGNVGRLAVYVNDYSATNLLLSTGTTNYLVAAGLNYNVSNVTLAYALEPGMSGANAAAGRFITFVGFETSFGGVFEQRAPAQRVVLVLGDSITAGSGYDKLESVNGPMSFETGCNPWAPALGNSQAENWESHLCRYFRANCTTIAWSGGMLLNPAGNGTTCPTRKWVPALFPLAFATDAASVWDFARSERPDAAIIFLGTNDYGCGAQDAPFTAATIELIANVTQAYTASPPSPSGAAATHFFLVIGPMSPTKPLAALQAAIAQANAAGISASLLDMRNATLDGCGGHPGPVGHWQMALMAKPQIEAAMGW